MNTEQAMEQSTEQNLDNMIFQTKEIACIECGNDFSFSPGEQKYFLEQGFINQPKRCCSCRVVRRMMKNGQELSTLAKVNCVECNKETILPFLPTQGKPVFCTSCFIKSGRVKKKS